jgi:hypothetical protein
MHYQIICLSESVKQTAATCSAGAGEPPDIILDATSAQRHPGL